MRTVRDALLSLRWYLVEVLAPVPPLLEIRFGGTSWTPLGRGVEGAYEVSERQWALLAAQFSLAEEVDWSAAYPWIRRTLIEDPRAAASARGMPLPDATTGAVAAVGFAFAPDPEWEIRESGDKGMLNLPLALVLPVGDLSPVSGSAYAVDYTQGAEIQCYPVPLATVDESMAQAREVEERLHRGFRLRGVGLGRPLRVPLWDFDGVNPEESESFYRGERDYLRVSGFSTSLIPEEDRRQIRVVASLTLGWRRSGRLPTGPLLQDVHQHPVGGL